MASKVATLLERSPAVAHRMLGTYASTLVASMPVALLLMGMLRPRSSGGSLERTEVGLLVAVTVILVIAICGVAYALRVVRVEQRGTSANASSEPK